VNIIFITIEELALNKAAVNIDFKQFTCQQQNKEYLIALFRRWSLSCKEFLSEHFC